MGAMLQKGSCVCASSIIKKFFKPLVLNHDLFDLGLMCQWNEQVVRRRQYRHLYQLSKKNWQQCYRTIIIITTHTYTQTCFLSYSEGKSLHLISFSFPITKFPSPAQFFFFFFFFFFLITGVSTNTPPSQIMCCHCLSFKKWEIYCGLGGGRSHNIFNGPLTMCFYIFTRHVAIVLMVLILCCCKIFYKASNHMGTFT